MAKNFPHCDKNQKIQLLGHAKNIIISFLDGIVKRGGQDYFEPFEGPGVYFDNYMIRYNQKYLDSVQEFVRLLSTILKSKRTHENMIRTMCQNAGVEYIKETYSRKLHSDQALAKASERLVAEVLAEGDKEYLYVHANYLIQHLCPGEINLGRVKSMPSVEFVELDFVKSKNTPIVIKAGKRQVSHTNPGTGEVKKLTLPPDVWVVRVDATKENVPEEAKWLIDVAVSLMRLSTKHWSRQYSGIGKQELNPIYPSTVSRLHLLVEDNAIKLDVSGIMDWYITSEQVVADLKDKKIQDQANVLFDPPPNSLALRVAQGLGWMTRGRQATDRAERLISFFTALEALLTSNDTTAPVTQNISRYFSVIYAQDNDLRQDVYNKIKRLYNRRSAVIHAGRRDVLWDEVNMLQRYTEDLYSIVLNSCDLRGTQEAFEQSLQEASHGKRWKFALDSTK